MASDPINAAEIAFDARTWNFYFERVVATVVVDAILDKVFQGKREDLREQMLNVASKQTRRIAWSDMVVSGGKLDLQPEARDAVIREARAILEARYG